MQTIESFFQDYAKALLSFSPEKISSFYQVPLTVYSDNGVIQVTKESETEKFWEQGIKPYKKMNIATSVPEIVSQDQLSETIYTAKVLWKNYDDTGKQIATETNFYILSYHKSGLKISGLIIMTQP